VPPDRPDLDALVTRLGLLPHPEGGFYRETYRAPVTTRTARGERAASTAIYFLLRREDVSALHRIASDEGWHFHAGAPLRIVCLDERGHTELHLGLDLAAGQAPQAVVPAGTWFGARSEGDFTLVSCTVAPGFDFADFELGDRAALEREYPDHVELIRSYTNPVINR
jgi:predicted cupin superfamily sugar epimerase